MEGFDVNELKSSLMANINSTSILQEDPIESVNTKLKPLISNLENVLKKTDKVTNIFSSVIPYLPLTFAIVDIAVILIYLGLIIIMIINPSRAFGIEISRNIYSSFYLTTTIVLFVLLIYFANPLLDNVEKLTSDTTQSTGTTVIKLIDKVLSFYNKIINISIIPVIILETIYMVLLVFLLSFMFIIATAMVRTYFALQCKYDQKIRASWWAYLVDVGMYCSLFIFAAVWTGLLILYYLANILSKLPIIGKYIKYVKLFDIQNAMYYSRRCFLITVAYYILKVIFSGLEYGISNNILAISKWEQPLNECESAADQAKNKKPEYIFYLFLNIMLCICIWILIIIFIIGHIIIYVYGSAYVSKANTLVKLVTKAFLFLLSGMVTFGSVESKITEFTKTLENIIPGGIPGGTPDVVGMAKEKIQEMINSNPNINIEDFLKNLNVEDIVKISDDPSVVDITKIATKKTKDLAGAISKEKAPAFVKSEDTEPVEAKPVETKPVETKPVATKPVATKPVATKPVETTTAEESDD
jgi:hypothetical protein